MSVAEIASSAERLACARCIEQWAAGRLDEGGALVAAEYQSDSDAWYLRLHCDEKEFVTIWLTVRQRTMRHEAQVMPAPETNVRETYEYLLRRNADISQMRLALGPEDAIYLIGEVPVTSVDDGELDRIVGSSLAYVDAVFPVAMSIGFAGRYRRRPR